MSCVVCKEHFEDQFELAAHFMESHTTENEFKVCLQFFGVSISSLNAKSLQSIPKPKQYESRLECYKCPI